MCETYDAIIVGARCAGSATAMLLARKGYRVLLVDRATFPSDTVSTHVIHPAGIATLSRWGLLDRLVATGMPAIAKYAFDFGPLTIEGTPGAISAPVSYCPRRTILDKLMIDSAAEAGAEVREGCTVTEVLTGDGGVTGIRGRMRDGALIEEHARVVIGADGRRSLVAESVHAPRYNEKPPLLASYYAYFSGLPMTGRFEIYARPKRGFAAAPTHDGLTMIVVGWPYAEFAQNQKDLETHFFNALDLAPEFAARVSEGHRETNFAGTPVPNFFRKPYGAGWVLVGDAGYNRIPLPPRASRMRSGTQSGAYPGSMRSSAGVGRLRMRWPNISENEMRTYFPCTSSRVSWRCSNRRRHKCRNSSRPCVEILRR